MNLVVLFLSLYAVIALAIALMLRRAPMGYEDAAGFHRGEREAPEEELPTAQIEAFPSRRTGTL